MDKPPRICAHKGCTLAAIVDSDYCPRHVLPPRIRHNLPEDHQSHAGHRTAPHNYADSVRRWLNED